MNWKTEIINTGLLICALALCARAQEPLRSAWIISPNQNAQVARIQPEVHSVKSLEQKVEIRSAGISLYYLGPMQTPADHVERIRQLQFTLPRSPVAAPSGMNLSVRPDVVGVFVNGVPIYNQFTALSYQGQNLWHFDPIAGGDDGTFTATGGPRAESHPGAWGLMEKLMSDSSRHSPIIGFAFDGYPIYGPWGFADGTGKLQQMLSGYRLRQLKRRTSLPDGTQLTPGQYGPDVSADFPLGSFVEDYEFVAGVGELDEFNGRFCKTPEYPQGTYAYFLATDGKGRLAYPYLLAGQYFGKLTNQELSSSVIDTAGENNPFVNTDKTLASLRSNNKIEPIRFELQVKGEALAAGQPVRLSFQLRNEADKPIRHLEFVHERPLHLLIVSDDLAEFEHIHPELVAGDRYEITHIFRHGGGYRLYADFTPPGEAQRIVSFAVTVEGRSRAWQELKADDELTKRLNSLQLTLTPKQELRAGEDIEFAFIIRDVATGKPVTNLEPYLGAWAHFVIIDPQHQSFIHAHPLEDSGKAKPTELTQAHVHSAESLGPPPEEIRTITSFPRGGLYKLWAQFQLDGQTIVQPFVLSVAEARPRTQTTTTIPADAIQIKVGSRGFAPAQLKIEANRPTTLAITRDTQPNCANRILIPALGISRDLPLGETIIIELPAQKAGEFSLTCGMGMYKGLIVVQ